MGVFYNFTAGMDFDRKLTLRSMLKKFDFLEIYSYLFFNSKGTHTYRIIESVKSQTFRVLWMLEELRFPYEHQNVPPHSAEILA